MKWMLAKFVNPKAVVSNSVFVRRVSANCKKVLDTLPNHVVSGCMPKTTECADLTSDVFSWNVLG